MRVGYGISIVSLLTFSHKNALVSVERIVLDLESEVMTGPGSIPTGDNILSLDFST